MQGRGAQIFGAVFLRALAAVEAMDALKVKLLSLATRQRNNGSAAVLYLDGRLDSLAGRHKDRRWLPAWQHQGRLLGSSGASSHHVLA
jgi:hypothetical protein